MEIHQDVWEIKMNWELCDIPCALGNSVCLENYLNLNNFSLLCVVLFYKKYTNIFENIIWEWNISVDNLIVLSLRSNDNLLVGSPKYN